MERQATEEGKIRRMRLACWINKARDTHTHTQNMLYLFLFHARHFPRKAPQVTTRSLSVCLYLLQTTFPVTII